MANEPIVKERPYVKLTFLSGSLANTDFGYLFTRFEFKGMVNGGYIVKITLADLGFNILSQLIEDGYFKETRRRPIPIKFQLSSGKNGTYPETATKPQIAIILDVKMRAKGGNLSHVSFTAIDPPSWYLNIGDASGGVWKGRVDQVIKQVVNKYAPGINVDVDRTVDSDKNKWWMMRMDPKTFISSLMEWSSSITQKKTQWLLTSDGYDLSIREQASFISRQRAFYRYFSRFGHSTISGVEIIGDNSLSILQSKLVTSGASAVSGQYLDRITDLDEKKVFVKDSRTENKQIPKTNDDQSFTKPNDTGPTNVGWTSITSIPEIYSAGDLGLKYDDYIDGKPRSLWLNMVNSLLRAKFTVLGHGEWSDSRGLGVDTIFIKWPCNKSDSGETYWWATGSWLVYGFHHKATSDGWSTDLYCARYDHDSNAKKVGGPNPE